MSMFISLRIILHGVEHLSKKFSLFFSLPSRKANSKNKEKLSVGCVVAQRNAPPTILGALAYYGQFIFLHIYIKYSLPTYLLLIS